LTVTSRQQTLIFVFNMLNMSCLNDDYLPLSLCYGSVMKPLTG
jgi:hypothetical protein